MRKAGRLTRDVDPATVCSRAKCFISYRVWAVFQNETTPPPPPLSPRRREGRAREKGTETNQLIPYLFSLFSSNRGGGALCWLCLFLTLTGRTLVPRVDKVPLKPLVWDKVAKDVFFPFKDRTREFSSRYQPLPARTFNGVFHDVFCCCVWAACAVTRLMWGDA